MVRNPLAGQDTWVRSLCQEDPLEKQMATPSTRILAWKIPWIEEHGRLQSLGSQRVKHNWATKYTHTQGTNILIMPLFFPSFLAVDGSDVCFSEEIEIISPKSLINPLFYSNLFLHLPKYVSVEVYPLFFPFSLSMRKLPTLPSLQMLNSPPVLLILSLPRTWETQFSPAQPC